MLNPRAGLDALIGDFLGHQLPFAAFQARYSQAYADDDADRDFPPGDVEFYGTIHERAEWTTRHPTAQERGDGWQDESEFLNWLRSFVNARIE